MYLFLAPPKVRRKEDIAPQVNVSSYVAGMVSLYKFMIATLDILIKIAN